MPFTFIMFYNEKQLFTKIGILNVDRFLHSDFFLKVTTLKMFVIFCFFNVIIFTLHCGIVQLPFVAFMHIMNMKSGHELNNVSLFHKV